MKTLSVVLSAVLVCLLVQDARSAVPQNGVTFPMKYEGGSLSLAQHDKLKTTVGDTELTFVQGKQTITIPLKSITEVSYGNDVHRRVGTANPLEALLIGVAPRRPHAQNSCNSLQFLSEARQTASGEL